MVGRKSLSELSLDSLAGVSMDAERIRRSAREDECEVEKYKRRYGADWFEVYRRDKNPRPDYDVEMKLINSTILHGTYLCVSGSGPVVARTRARMAERERELYGDRYDEFRGHLDGDTRVAELLLRDAIRTGKWKELPDELQAEYHERVGSST